MRSPWRSSTCPASVSDTGRGPPGRSTSVTPSARSSDRDLLADRRLGVAELLGRARERARLRDRAQRDQMADLDAGDCIRVIDRHSLKLALD